VILRNCSLDLRDGFSALNENKCDGVVETEQQRIEQAEKERASATNLPSPTVSNLVFH
jgi:hypothetical protein